MKHISISLSTVAVLAALPFSATAAQFFLAGNLVVAVSGNGVQGASGGTYTDNQATPLTLFQYQTSGTSAATYVNSLVLPQTTSGANFAISAEYGSSSEGTLQLSGDGRYLTIMGYGINAGAFNTNPALYSADGNPALAQSGNLSGQSYTTVRRVAALIDANGQVDTTTALLNVFSANNPRSAYTVNGTSIYISGQGTSGDATGGVFYTLRGNTGTPTTITGNDAGSGASQDTRVVEIVNGTLYVSADSKSGPTNRDFIGTLGTAGTPPTSLANAGNGPTRLTGFASAGKVTITTANSNGINTNSGTVNISPTGFFFANASTLYVADTGRPKNDSALPSGTTLGDGGLQKWVNSKSDGTGTWSLQYTIYGGLGLQPNTATNGTSGLRALTGQVSGDQVQLFAINETLSDLDPTALYGVTDSLSATALGVNENFTKLADAPVDSNFTGVAFTPTPEPGTIGLLGFGIAGLVAWRRSRRG